MADLGKDESLESQNIQLNMADLGKDENLESQNIQLNMAELGKDENLESQNILSVLINCGMHECFEKCWPTLEAIVKKVFEGVHLDTKKPTPEEYMTGYVIVFDASRCFKCSESYFWKYHSALIDYLSFKVLPELEQKNGESLLKELLQQCKNYKTFADGLFKMFQHLQENKLVGLPSLTETTRYAFHDLVYREVKNRMTDALIFEINRERNGEQIDHALMKNVLKIYVEIGGGDRMYYEKDFEGAMIADTTKFYFRKAIEWLLMCSSNASSPYDAYMQKFYGSMEEEGKRVNDYLDFRSLYKLMQVVEHQLLAVHERKLADLKKSKYEKRMN